MQCFLSAKVHDYYCVTIDIFSDIKRVVHRLRKGYLEEYQTTIVIRVSRSKSLPFFTLARCHDLERACIFAQDLDL